MAKCKCGKPVEEPYNQCEECYNIEKYIDKVMCDICKIGVLPLEIHYYNLGRVELQLCCSCSIKLNSIIPAKAVKEEDLKKNEFFG